MSDAPRKTMWVARFAAVGLIAASAAWFLNELVVWQLGRHAPEPPAPMAAMPAAPMPETPPTVAPEIVVEHVPAVGTKPAAPDREPVARSAPPSDHEKKRKKTPTKPRKRRSAPRKPASDNPASDNQQVRVFTIDKQKLKARFKQPSDTAGHGHIMPNWVDGERRGMKFADVAPTGIFARLGIQSDDVVMSVNGIEITTQQKALADLKRLRKERTFDVVLQRDGNERRHRYILK